MALSPAWFAFRVVADRISANEGLRLAQAAGLGIRRADFLRMVGQARSHYGQRIAELDRPLNARPAPQEITTVDTHTQTGYIQYVDVITRNTDTGTIRVRPMAVRSQGLLSRDNAVQRALSQYRTAIDRSKVTPAQWDTDPRETVVGGLYQATHQLSPSAS